MQMSASRETIETVISQNTCLKNFECYHNKYESLCKVRLIEEKKTLLECIDDGGDICEHPYYKEGIRFCGCKVRAVIVQELGI